MRLMAASDAIFREYDIGHDIRNSLEAGRGYLWLTIFASTLRNTAYAERSIDRFLLRLQAVYESMHSEEFATRVEDNDNATNFDCPTKFDSEDKQVRRYVMYEAGLAIESGK